MEMMIELESLAHQLDNLEILSPLLPEDIIVKIGTVLIREDLEFVLIEIAALDYNMMFEDDDDEYQVSSDLLDKKIEQFWILFNYCYRGIRVFQENEYEPFCLSRVERLTLTAPEFMD